MLIDTHCHLDFSQFDEDRNLVISRAKAASVRKMITIGCHLAAAKTTIQIAEVDADIFAAVGIHPNDIGGSFEQDFDKIREYARHKKVVAIGETGFDFFRSDKDSEQRQTAVFEQHVALARELNKPVIVHLRDADRQAENFFAKYHDFPFVVHCFSGNWDFALKIFDYGGMISFTGIVTFKNADPALIEVAKKAPPDRIMVETDAPFLAPVPHRGKRNEPAFTRNTAEFLATLRGEDFENFAKQTTQNAEKFFGLI